MQSLQRTMGTNDCGCCTSSSGAVTTLCCGPYGVWPTTLHVTEIDEVDGSGDATYDLTKDAFGDATDSGVFFCSFVNNVVKYHLSSFVFPFSGVWVCAVDVGFGTFCRYVATIGGCGYTSVYCITILSCSPFHAIGTYTSAFGHLTSVEITE